MAASKNRMTMAKRNREQKLVERRQEKRARKVARRASADEPDPPSETVTREDGVDSDPQDGQI